MTLSDLLRDRLPYDRRPLILCADVISDNDKSVTGITLNTPVDNYQRPSASKQCWCSNATCELMQGVVLENGKHDKDGPYGN